MDTQAHRVWNEAVQRKWAPARVVHNRYISQRAELLRWSDQACFAARFRTITCSVSIPCKISHRILNISVIFRDKIKFQFKFTRSWNCSYYTLKELIIFRKRKKMWYSCHINFASISSAALMLRLYYFQNWIQYSLCINK